MAEHKPSATSDLASQTEPPTVEGESSELALAPFEASSRAPSFDSLPSSQNGVSWLEFEFMKLDDKQSEALLGIEQREEELGKLVMECLRVIRELSKIHGEEAELLQQKIRLARMLPQAGDYFDRFNLEMRFRNHLRVFSNGSGSSRRSRTPPTLISSTLRTVGAAFYSNPSLIGSPFANIWDTFASLAYVSRPT